jgi:hypothetical protein
MNESEKLQMAQADAYGRAGMVVATITIVSLLCSLYFFHQAAIGA